MDNFTASSIPIGYIAFRLSSKMYDFLIHPRIYIYIYIYIYILLIQPQKRNILKWIGLQKNLNVVLYVFRKKIMHITCLFTGFYSEYCIDMMWFFLIPGFVPMNVSLELIFPENFWPLHKFARMYTVCARTSVCVCVCKSERERESVCVCVCKSERERESVCVCV